MTSRRPNRDKRPHADYGTGEIAELFDISINTVIRWIKAGKFGAEGKDWWWTEAGPGSGERRVRYGAVQRHLRKETHG